MIGVTATKDAAYYLKPPCSAEHHTRTGPAEYELAAAAAGEPAGVWVGANPLGLTGEVVPDHFRTLVNQLRDPRTKAPLGPRPPHFKTTDERTAEYMVAHQDATPEEIADERVRIEKDKRDAVHAWDITFSLPKSWSVLHAALEREGRHDEAEQVWAAAQVGVEAALNVARRDHSWVRTQRKGEATTYQQAPEWIAAMFRHHTSREQDPQLHSHVAVLNRVLVNGQWKALFSPALTRNKHMLDAVFLRVAEAELTRTMGVRFAARPDGKAREVVGVSPAARGLFSARTRAIVAGAQAMVDEFEKLYDRKPGALVTYLLHQQITRDSRKAKPKTAPTRAELLKKWEQTLAAQMRGGFADVVDAVDQAREEPAVAELFDPVRVIAAAVADMDSHKATWSRSQLYLAISNHLPDHLEVNDPDEVIELLDELTDAALASRDVVAVKAPPVVPTPAFLKGANGQSVQDAPASPRFTTRTQLDREESVVARLGHTGAPVVPAAKAMLALEGAGLSPQQQAVAMTALTSPRRLHVVDAAAGSGKSRTLGALSAASEQLTGKPLVGFTTAQNAAKVMESEGVGKAHNIAAYLDFAERAERGEVSQEERDRFAVPAGSIVAIDEASMVSADHFQRLADRLDEVGVGRVLAVGDTQQVDAVDQAGTFSLLAERGDPLALTEVRRFVNDWEREASVALRGGDAAKATRAYETRGRLHGGDHETVQAELVRDTAADILAGRDVVAVTSTSDAAATVASRIREQLVEAGRVEETGVPLRDGTVGGVGDVVQARLNDRQLEGGEVINRETFRVTAVTEDGGLEVQRAEGRDPETGERVWAPPRELPAAYASEWVELAYAGTVHAVQGRTVEVGRALADETMAKAALYPATTRGTTANHTYLPTRDGETAAGRFAAIVGKDDRELSATATIRNEVEQSRSLAELGPRWQSVLSEQRAAVHTDIVRDVLGDKADGVLADDQSHSLFALLRSAESSGHDPRELVAQASTRGQLDGARSPAAYLRSMVDQELDAKPQGEAPRPFTYEGRTPTMALGADNGRIEHARALAKAMDDRTAELGQRTAADAPAWATARFGPTPTDDAERPGWGARTAVVAAYREQYEWSHPDDAIGPKPGRNEPEKSWAWNRAADIMGLSPAERDLAAASDGDLIARQEMWEREKSWLPPNVDDRLKVAHVARDQADRNAIAARAEGRDAATEEAALARQAERVAQNEEIAAAREKAVQETAQTKATAREATAELARRSPDGPTRNPDPEPARDVEPVQSAPEPDRTMVDLEAARAATWELVERETARDAARTPDPPEPTREPVAERDEMSR